MKTNEVKVPDQLNACLKDRQKVADEIQNEINQILASVLLWIQFTKKEHNLKEDKSFLQAEINLKEAIARLQTLHYFLVKNA